MASDSGGESASNRSRVSRRELYQARSRRPSDCSRGNLFILTIYTFELFVALIYKIMENETLDLDDWGTDCLLQNFYDALEHVSVS